MNKNKWTKSSSKRPVSQINPDLLVKKSKSTNPVAYVSSRKFEQIRLHKDLLNNIAAKGYQSPSEIQDKCLDQLMAGRNIVGIAATGTGKTGAFLIPIIQQMMTTANVSSLVVVPTRELAQQVQAEFVSLTKNTRLRSACFIGGTNVGKDMMLARRKTDLIVGTPGRLNDLIDRKALNIQNISILVLDEFDRMLDMGFVKDIKRLVGGMQSRKQTLLFSATLDPTQEKLISQITGTAIRVNVTNGSTSSDNVDQNIIRVKSQENKFDVLVDLVKGSAFEKVLLFAETKRGVDKLSKQLIRSGMKSDVLHGNKSQNYRTKAIELFKAGKIKILVATDVAARGIDIKGVTHVINYQLPQTMDSYIHRIGRTGRAEATGVAYTFVN